MTGQPPFHTQRIPVPMRREFDDLAAFNNAFFYGNRLKIAPDQHLPLTAVEATAPLHHLFS